MRSSVFTGAVCAAVVAGCALAATDPTPQGLPRPQADLMASAANDKAVVFLQYQTDTLVSSTGVWEQTMDGVNTITGAAATVGSQIVVVGGGGQSVSNNNCSIFDPDTKVLSNCAKMPSARGFLSAAAVGNKLFAIGGFAKLGWNIVESFDMDTGKWTTGLASLPTPRYGASAASVNGIVYVIGGIAWHTPASNANEAYDPSTNTWTKKAAMPTARAYFGCTVYNNKIYALGGDDSKQKLVVAEAYDPATDSWTTATPIPAPERAHFAAVALTDRILLLGGATGNGLQQHPLDNADPYTP